MSPKGKTLAVPSCYHHAILIPSRVAGRAGNLYSALPSAGHGWQTSKSVTRAGVMYGFDFTDAVRAENLCPQTQFRQVLSAVIRKIAASLRPSASTCQKRNRNGHLKAIPWSIPTSNWPFFLFNKGMNQIKLISDSAAIKNISSASVCATLFNFTFTRYSLSTPESWQIFAERKSEIPEAE